MLYQLDDTIKQSEVNMLFDDMDRDSSGTISVQEFELYFKLETGAIYADSKIEGMRWAANIFGELNKKLSEKE